MKHPKVKQKSRFGDYYTRRLVHAGDKSMVLEATQMSCNQIFAIKVYTKKYDLMAKKIEKKYDLLSEAETGLMLNPGDTSNKNSRLVATFAHGKEYGTRKGCRYIVQEFLKGVTLKRLISCSDDRVLKNMNHWAFEMCMGLKEIHSKGLIYRDMCSDNIMLTHEGKVKILDLGFVAPENTVFTERGGTPSYMAPEQASAEPVTIRSDIYSLGIVLFEMLTGTLPYRPSTPGGSAATGKKRHMALMEKHINAPPPRFSDQLSEKHPAITQIITRCLQKKPGDRVENVDKVLDMLS